MDNIDKIPMPDRSLLNKEYFKPKISYNKIMGERVVEAGLMTSRGCPYKCAFCSASAFWNKIRFHSPKYVAKEIKY
ncbi:MAG: radical SAM protein, partial [Candidatus Nanoarchaeia archaeon]